MGERQATLAAAPPFARLEVDAAARDLGACRREPTPIAPRATAERGAL